MTIARLTEVNERGGFLIAGELVLLLNMWPLFDESNYLLYVVLFIWIGSLFIGKKREFLLPQNILSVVVGDDGYYYYCKNGAIYYVKR